MDATESNFDDDDTHICLKCQMTIIGLDNYILHRRSKCTALNLVAPTIRYYFTTDIPELHQNISLLL